ncbi:MAG: MAPEG family protein [Polyangiaceae bacterium]|nr:MAPEG family protein [Polyangiaceae bacterium]
MTIPMWVLLAFASWTLFILMATVGIYRWALILTGRAEIKAFRADDVHGSDFYKLAMRAHANCVENLVVYAAIVVVLFAAGLDRTFLDVMALVILGARIVHTAIHVALSQTNVVAGFRFGFFFIQLLCMLGMIGYVVIA